MSDLDKKLKINITVFILACLVIWQCPVADRRKNPCDWGEGPSNATKNKTGKSYQNQHKTHLKNCHTMKRHSQAYR